MRLITAILLLACAPHLMGQINLPKLQKDEFNYVPNPSFEVTKDIPCYWNQGLGKFEKWFIDWSSPTETTPDLLSTQSKSTCWSHPEKNNGGKQYPRSGVNMIGMKFYGVGGTDTYWHEYIQIELEKPLKKDSLYYAEFWVNLSSKASKACDNIGIYFSHSLYNTRNRLPLIMTPQINSGKIIKPGISKWRKVKGVFMANGGEKYLMIGNFYSDDQTNIERIPGGRDGAYYFIDDVKVRNARPGERVTPNTKISNKPTPRMVVEERISSNEVVINKTEYKVGAVIELENIFFEFDKAELLPESQSELQKLADLLFDYPHLEIEISGHTDNIGSDTYNQELSEARAKAVVDFLLEKEVENARLSFAGYGSNNPIDTNDTDRGRQNNRRVEFKVLKN